jgi:hypothetical protein
MDPDEVALALSEGCIMVCGRSWALAGPVRTEAGCMVSVETGGSRAHGICATAQTSTSRPIAGSRRFGRGARPQRAFLARVDRGTREINGQARRTALRLSPEQRVSGWES